MPIYLEIGPPAGKLRDPKDPSLRALDETNSIGGTVTETLHQNWIELTSCQVKGNDTSSTSHGANMSDFKKDIRSVVCTRNVDGTSPELMKIVAGQGRNGDLVAWIDFVKDPWDGAKGYASWLRIKMDGVAITSYQASGRAPATETFELNFGVVRFHDSFGDGSAVP